MLRNSNPQISLNEGRPEESVNIHIEDNNILDARNLEEIKVISEEPNINKVKDLEKRFDPYLTFAYQKSNKTCNYTLKK